MSIGKIETEFFPDLDIWYAHGKLHSPRKAIYGGCSGEGATEEAAIEDCRANLQAVLERRRAA